MTTVRCEKCKELYDSDIWHYCPFCKIHEIHCEELKMADIFGGRLG